MAHRIAQQAEIDLDDIWVYVAQQSGSMETATRVLESISSRFLLLARFPEAGRTRSRDLGPGIRSFVSGDYLILYCQDAEDVVILRVVHGSRNLERLGQGFRLH